MKTRQENNLIDHIGTVYAENYIELPGPIESGAIYTKTRQNNDVIDLIGVIYIRKKIELS